MARHRYPGGMSKADWETLDKLERRGFVVAVWTPGETRGTSRQDVRDRIIEYGNEIIKDDFDFNRRMAAKAAVRAEAKAKAAVRAEAKAAAKAG